MQICFFNRLNYHYLVKSGGFLVMVGANKQMGG